MDHESRLHQLVQATRVLMHKYLTLLVCWITAGLFAIQSGRKGRGIKDKT